MEVDQETVFHLTDMTILNLFLIHKSFGGKILVREFIIHSQQENLTASGIQRADQVKLQCRVCSLHKQTRQCDDLCVVNCFELRVNLSH